MTEIFFTLQAKKNLLKLDKHIKKKIISSIKKLENDTLHPLPLTGSWKGWYKMRVGTYRVLLTRDTKNIWIVGYIRHRREAYKED